MTFRTLIAALLLAAGALGGILPGASHAQAQSAIGGLRVHGPGYVVVGNRYFHLLGVSGVHADEACAMGGNQYHCGILSTAKLVELSAGVRYHCQLETFPGDARVWGTCIEYDREVRGPAPDGVSLNRQWVQSGWGLPHTLHSDVYAADGAVAQAAGLGLWAAPPAARAFPADVVGPAEIVEGDTLKIDGIRIQLLGVDAPELNQTCTFARRTVRCGIFSRAHLIELAMGTLIHCRISEFDDDDRAHGVCGADGANGGGLLADRPTLNEQMIRDGWALADSLHGGEYEALQDEARFADRGLWAGTFQAPALWRAGGR